MNEENQESVKAAAEEAVKKGANIREEIRDITMEALSQHKLDTERVKSVAKAVMDGAMSGLDVDSSKMKQSLNEVTEGLDAALEKSAQATKLAIEETVSKVKDFNDKDFKRTLDELASLEELFLETLEETAKAGKTLLSETLNDLLTHAKNTGTAVGQRTKADVAELTDRVKETSEAGVNAATDAAKSFTADIAQAASGFLSALAESLKESEKNQK